MSIIKKLSGRARKKFLRAYALPAVRRRVNNLSKGTPTPQLGFEHLENARLVPTRQDMLELLPKGGVVAELGVDQGYFSEDILRISQPSKLHLVDAWGSMRFGEDKQQAVRQKFSERTAAGQVEFHIGLSTDKATDFSNGYFDWIYIDTAHDYKTTRDELAAYHAKVKLGGIIAGHDYAQGSWRSLMRYGVVEAVAEFCIDYGWELIYQSCETDINPSFAIRKRSGDALTP